MRFFLDFMWDTVIFVYELYMKQLAAMTDDVFHRQAVFPGHHGKGEGAALCATFSARLLTSQFFSTTCTMYCFIFAK